MPVDITSNHQQFIVTRHYRNPHKLPICVCFSLDFGSSFMVKRFDWMSTIILERMIVVEYIETCHQQRKILEIDNGIHKLMNLRRYFGNTTCEIFRDIIIFDTFSLDRFRSTLFGCVVVVLVIVFICQLSSNLQVHLKPILFSKLCCRFFWLLSSLK